MLETEPELQFNVREFIELTVERSQKAMQMTMIEGFEQLNSKVLHIQEEFSKVKKYLKGGSSGSMFQVSSSTKLPALPVKSLEELNNLEEVLEDEEEKHCLILKLSIYVWGVTHEVNICLGGHNESGIDEGAGKPIQLTWEEKQENIYKIKVVWMHCR